jgi:hypothetical protein
MRKWTFELVIKEGNDELDMVLVLKILKVKPPDQEVLLLVKK